LKIAIKSLKIGMLCNFNLFCTKYLSVDDRFRYKTIIQWCLRFNSFFGSHTVFDYELRILIENITHDFFYGILFGLVSPVFHHLYIFFSTFQSKLLKFGQGLESNDFPEINHESMFTSSYENVFRCHSKQ
jgi:hypothetical protein